MPVDHQVVGFDVAMDNSQGVGVAKAISGCCGELEGFCFGDLAAGPQLLLEGSLMHEFHRVVVGIIFMADVEHLHDIGMVEAGGCTSFGDETGHEHRVLGEFLGQHFEGDFTMQADLFSAVDGPHATLAENFD